MKFKFLITVSLFCLSLFCHAQHGAIKITDNESQKEIIIKENKRIRLKTVEGEKISGRFTIIDANTILVKGMEIHLSEIRKIKKNPLVVSILTNAAIAYFVSVGTLLTYLVTGSSEVAVILGLSGITYSIIKSPNILKGYKTDAWNIEIIETY